MSRTAALEATFTELADLASGRTLVVPTYDYSFTASGLFDMGAKRTDLGALSKEVLRREAWRREATPVFSHSSFHHTIAATQTPFSADSFFHVLSETESRIYLLGVDVSRMTFIHYLEDRYEIPYRYEKKFTGNLLSNDRAVEVSVSFHVRPPTGIVHYDFEKISLLLSERKVLKTLRSKSAFLKPAEALDILHPLVARDPLWLLTSDSKRAVGAQLDFYGRSFKIEDFE